MILVDTSIWSLALRRRREQLSDSERLLVVEWEQLARSGEAGCIGPIRQEILSGIRSPKDFAALQSRLSSFDEITLLPDDYDHAAALFNQLRAKGISGGAIDLLICAAAIRSDVPIFTSDPDFLKYAREIPIQLHTVRR